MLKKISVVSPCYNEYDNLEIFYTLLCNTINKLTEYEFEILFIDNCSTDGTQEKLKYLANSDSRVKVILNTRNFGQVRSPYWGLLQSSGDAAILIASDLQDPPFLITELIDKWNKGWKVVLGQKNKSETNYLIHILRKIYYKTLKKISDLNVIENANGFGLYDKDVIRIIEKLEDPYPYLRGMVCEIGLPITTIDYIQKKRNKGKSKSNFLHLYDVAILGLINNSIMPLRMISFVGITTSLISILCFIIILTLKFIDLNYSIMLPMIINSIYFLFGLLFCFIGIVGEYIASIFIYVRKRPPVIEKNRINF